MKLKNLDIHNVMNKKCNYCKFCNLCVGLDRESRIKCDAFRLINDGLCSFGGWSNMGYLKIMISYKRDMVQRLRDGE